MQREFCVRCLFRAALIAWPVTTWAAGNSLGDTFSSISLLDWLVLFALATFSGLVALLHRVKRSYEAAARQAAGLPADDADRVLINVWLFATFHFPGAWFMGFIGFLIGEAFGWNPHLESVVIAFAAWGGAKVAERLADAASDRAVNIIQTKEISQ